MVDELVQELGGYCKDKAVVLSVADDKYWGRKVVGVCREIWVVLENKARVELGMSKLMGKGGCCDGGSCNVGCDGGSSVVGCNGVSSVVGCDVGSIVVGCDGGSSDGVGCNGVGCDGV